MMPHIQVSVEGQTIASLRSNVLARARAKQDNWHITYRGNAGLLHGLLDISLDLRSEKA